MSGIFDPARRVASSDQSTYHPAMKMGGVLTGERVVRRLAAILVADVVGYSRLMGRDEDGTLARLREHRTLRFDPVVARYGGRLVKLMGDGALVEFSSAVDALSAAVAFQQAMIEANEDQPSDTAVVFRVGLHLGDFIVDSEDLYGDGVNVAARLEAEALPGGIVVSDSLHDATKGRLKATFEDLGGLILKNIERPIHAFRVEWKGEEWAISSPPSSAPSPASELTGSVAFPDKPSVAWLESAPSKRVHKAQDVPTPPTLLSLFKTDFEHCLRSEMPTTSTAPDGMNYQYTTRLFLDFQSGVWSGAFYLPRTDLDGELGYLVANSLVKEFPRLFDQLKGTVRVQARNSGDFTPVDVRDLTFSTRIYIYHEDDFTLRQMADLTDAFKQKSVTLHLRGAKYVSDRWMSERLRRLP